MEIREMQNKEEWEGFLESCTDKTFLQSWNWGELNVAMGNKVWRLGIYIENRLVGEALVIKVSARRGIFLFVPHGPALIRDLEPKDEKEIMELILLHLSDIAKKENASFVRVSPLFKNTEINQNVFFDLGFRQSPMHASAYEATWKLDIDLPEDELLKNMRKTTRYLVKKTSENPDISVEISTDPKNIEIFQKLNQQVAKKQNFVPFSDEFIGNEFEVFARDNQVVFVFGKYKGEIAAGALIIFWPASRQGGQGIGFYHQAASLGKFAKHSIPYLIQWSAIKEAKKRKCSVYDFWGFTDPEKFPHHPWAGPTLFKMGFGGYKKEYIKTQDYVLSNKYWLNYIIETVRRKMRGL